MSRRPSPTLERVAPRSPKTVPGNTPRKRVAARPCLELLPGGLDLSRLGSEARRFLAVLPSSGAIGLLLAAKISGLDADEVAVSVALLAGYGLIDTKTGEHRSTVRLTPKGAAMRRRQPVRGSHSLDGEVAA